MTKWYRIHEAAMDVDPNPHRAWGNGRIFWSTESFRAPEDMWHGDYTVTHEIKLKKGLSPEETTQRWFEEEVFLGSQRGLSTKYFSTQMPAYVEQSPEPDIAGKFLPKNKRPTRGSPFIFYTETLHTPDRSPTLGYSREIRVLNMDVVNPKKLKNRDFEGYCGTSQNSFLEERFPGLEVGYDTGIELEDVQKAAIQKAINHAPRVQTVNPNWLESLEAGDTMGLDFSQILRSESPLGDFARPSMLLKELREKGVKLRGCAVVQTDYEGINAQIGTFDFLVCNGFLDGAIYATTPNTPNPNTTVQDVLEQGDWMSLHVHAPNFDSLTQILKEPEVAVALSKPA